LVKTTAVNQHIVPRAPLESVIAITSIEGINAAFAIKKVITTTTEEGVIAKPTVKGDRSKVKPEASWCITPSLIEGEQFCGFNLC
jgi:hypothetical protein